MKILKIDQYNPDPSLVKEVCDCLNNKGIIIYPTETIYGIGCIIDFEDSVTHIFKIKKRSLGNPMSVMFLNFKMLKDYTILSKDDEKFILENISKPYTFLVRKREEKISMLITASTNRVGVRFANTKLLKEILKKINKPIISTSANFSEKPFPGTFSEIDRRLIDSADVIIDSGDCLLKKPTMIVDIEKDEIRVR